MARTGRPSKYRPNFHPEDFLRLAKQGKVLSQIAREWEIDRQTIKDWAAKHKDFARTIKKGHEWAEAWWLDYFQAAAVGKVPKACFGAGIWVTKNAFNWADKVEQQEVSTQKISGSVVYKCSFDDVQPDNEETKAVEGKGVTNPRIR